MNRIVCIVVLVCLAFACVPSDEGSSPLSDQKGSPASAWKPTKKSSVYPAPLPLALPPISPGVPPLVTGQTAGPMATGAPVTTDPQSKQDIQKAWPSGAELLAEVDGFMATGFMKEPSLVGFGDLAYSDISLDPGLDNHGRIDQINGKLKELYDSYSFVIPVVRRRVDAISGSRQVNWEDVIVKLDETRWRVQPVALSGFPPFEIRIDRLIELIEGDSIIRIVKNGSDFAYTEHFRKADGQEELQVSWKIGQYERGPVHDILSIAQPGTLVPVVMVWEPGSIAGYLASLPEGQAEFVHRLRWEPTGELETDRYNFLVLLTQRHGFHLNIRDRIGAVDPVWLALMLYDHVVSP